MVVCGEHLQRQSLCPHPTPREKLHHDNRPIEQPFADLTDLEYYAMMRTNTTNSRS